jgi:hypothetical protein
VKPHLNRIAQVIALSLLLTMLASPNLVRGAAGPNFSYLPAVFTSGCSTFPANNIWNIPIDKAPVDQHSAAFIQSMGPSTGLHPDFGSGLWEGRPIGIPYVVVSGSVPWRSVSFDYADESDPGPYPIPDNVPIEGGPDSDGDRHVLVVNTGNCTLYELYAAYPQGNGSWTAGSGAIFDLRSNLLRPDGWTSADAAGLPIYPGLVRYDEYASGAIKHAIRFTAETTRDAYVWPARHRASDETSTAYPPMGQRFRLKASFNISRFTPQQQIFLKAFQTYGVILADNGSNWFISGAPDERWNNDWLLGFFGQLHGSDFEAVDVSAMQAFPNSGAVK